MMNRHPLLLVVLGASLLLALSACDAVHPVRLSDSHDSTSPAASASPDSHSLDDTVVIRISATAVANTGESARLVETVHAPHAITGKERATLTSALCRGWETEFPAGDGVPVELTMTPVTGTWPKLHQVAVVASYLSTAHTYTAAAWSGDWMVQRAPCSDGLARIPGAALGIIPIDPAAPVDTQSWGSGAYGFSSDVSEDAAAKTLVTLTECTVEVGPAAAASPRLASLKAASATHGCVLGSAE